jgi:hypothetical protein
MAIYYAEIGFKILANGLIMDKNSFLRKFWNIYDLLVVVCYNIHIYNPHTFYVDVSPFRMLNLLRLLGSILKG